MAPDIFVDNHAGLAARAAAILQREARSAFSARTRFAVALPGGSVAAAFFPTLASAGVDWRRTDFFWADERAVPEDDPESNFGLARRLWLGAAGVPASRLHRMVADAEDLEAAAGGYSRDLAAVVGEPPRLDLALLGLGGDGHVCSLFPGHPLLEERRLWVAAVRDSPKPPARRLTLTLPTLEAARLVVVAAFGEEKAEAVRRTLAASEPGLPLFRLVRGVAPLMFLLDPAAAGTLPALRLPDDGEDGPRN
jgi:6-phosphogluconolactonase